MAITPSSRNRRPARWTGCRRCSPATGRSPPLLHGDSWSGNAGALRHGEAVIFDPDVYFGDRKTDLSTTELFAGLPLAFC